MTLSLIVALSENGVIGREGQLPWRLSADLRRFKSLTMGHHLIMGRKTFDSIGRPLPGRISVVVTRQRGYFHEAAVVVHDWQQAMAAVEGDDQPFVIGGGEIYQLALPSARRIYVTRVHAFVEGDTYFPELPSDVWTLVERQRHEADERNQFPYTFEVLERRLT